jgi:hypothetical protein
MTTENVQTSDGFEVTLAAAFEQFRKNPEDHGRFITLMRDAYAQGAASMREETDLVCDAVETVAARQMNNSADAAIFALMVSLPPIDAQRTLSVTVDFDEIGRLIESFTFKKQYLAGGRVRFDIEPV